MRKTTQSSLELLLPVLSDVLTTIATVRDRSTLLKTIIAKLQPLFDFHDIGLFLVNEKENYHVDLAVDMPEINPLGSSMNHNIVPGKIAHQGSVVAWTIAQVEAAGQPVLFDFADLRQRFPDYPQWQGIPDGYRDCLVTTLKVQGEIIGMFCINALEKDKFATVDRTLFQLVTDQLAVALDNMLSHERLIEEKRFKETLLSISEAVASIQDRKHLFETIMANIKPVFPFDELGIFVNDDTGQYQRDLSIDNEFVVSAAFLHLTPKGWLPRHPSIDYFTEHGPSAMTLSELMRQFPDHPHYSIVQQGGLKQIIAGPLVQGGKPINLLCFWSRQEDFYSKAHLPMFRAISEQLSVAVANVLANEQVLLEKAKIERLYTVSEVMASIRHRHQLRAAFDRMRQVLPFDSAGLFVLTEDRQQHYELLDSSTLGGEVTQSRLEAQFGKYACYPHTPSPVEAMMQSEAVGLYSVADLLVRFPDYPQNPAVRAADLQQTIAAPLWQSEKIIGLLNFNSKQADQYSAADFPLMQAMAEQMSTVVSNILSNEREQEEKQFKETLLGISEAVASIQDRKELFRVIFERIQPLVKFDDFGLFHFSEDKKHYRDLAVVDGHGADNQVIAEAIPDGYLTNHDSVTVFVEQGPLVISLKELMKRFPGHPFYPFMKKASLKQIFGGPLIYQGKKLGMLAFDSKQENFYSKQDFPLFQAIADQLAVAVANVLANERLVEEKQFKEVLLGISEAVATVSSRSQLLKVIFEKVQPVLSFDAPGLFTIDGEYHYEILDKEVTNDEHNEQVWQDVGVGPFTNRGTIIQHIIDTQQAHITPIVTEMHPHGPAMLASGLKQVIYGPLKSRGKVIGMFCLNSQQADQYQEADLSLFQAIADQLAVAVANILSNEQLLAEKKKTEDLLAVTEAIANINSGPELIRAIFDKLQQVFPFDETGLFVIDWENQQERDLVIDYGYDTTVVSAALKEQGLYGWLPLQKLTRYLAEKGPMVIDADELLAKFSHPQLQYTEMPVFKQAIAGPLKKGDETIGLLYFWSMADHAFDTSLPFFKSITDQLSVALSNILATEDIRQRERENALQVAVVNALHAGTSWEEKLLGVAQQLQSFLPFDLFTVMLSEKQPDPLGYAFERIGHAEYRTLDTEAFLRLTKLSAERYRQLRHQHVYHEAFVANGRAFHELGERDTIKRTIAEVFKVESVLTVPLLLSRQSLSRPDLSKPDLSRQGLSRPGHFQFAFYRRSAEGYRPDQQALMHKITPSLTLALEKLVAYDEISELNARLSQEKSYLEEEIRTHYNFGQMVGESSALQEVFTQVNQVADTDSTVLLLGETGTGKELIARALHESSPRQKQSLIKINCAALPPQLIESELFGHEKGAFTGAAQRRIGKFELAHQSTIFLDEIGELPLELQSKLLRVLQEKEFERLGSNQVRRVDIRVVAATNRDLKEEVREGRFRQDLYYRLNVFPILLPPLRERGKDIGLLAQFFLRKYSAKFKKRLASLNDAQLNKLQRYSWPGNVRELEHLIERAVIQASGRIATLNLPTTDPYPDSTTANLSEAISSEDFVPKPWKDTEVNMLMGTLRYCEGKVRGEGGAAQLLDLHPNTLESRMKKLGIKRQHVIN